MVGSLNQEMDFRLPRRVAAAVGYELSCRLCAAAIESLRARLANVDIQLPESLGLTPIEAAADGALALDRWLESQTTPGERMRRWNAPPKQIQPFLPSRADGLHAADCVLLLSARHLTGASERAALIASLAAKRDAFCGFLLVFLDATGSEIPPLPDADAPSAWARAFTALSPGHVCVYLLSTTTQNGLIVPEDELTKLVAFALTADLIVPDPRAPRFLSHRSRDAIATVRTIGGRAIDVDHVWLADRFAPRLAADLLRETVFSDEPAEPAEPPLTGAVEVLRAAVGQELKQRMSLRIADESAGEKLRGQPSLVGGGMQATVDCGSLGMQLHLEGVPRRDWLQRLHEWDLLLREGVAPRLVRRTLASISEVETREAEQLRQHLAGALAREGGDAAIQQVGEVAADRISRAYAMHARSEGVPTLGEGLDVLRTALGIIPHGPSLLLRTTMLVVVPLLLLVHAWGLPASSIRSALLVVLPALTLIAVGAAIAVRMSRMAAAQKARDRAVEEAERRCQLKCVQEIASRFMVLHAALSERLERWLKQLSDVRDALRERAKACLPEQQEEPCASLIRLLPERSDHPALYAWLFGEESAAGDRNLRFLKDLKHALLSLLAGAKPTASVGDAVTAFARSELLRLMRSRLRLWQLLRKDVAGPFFRLDPDTIERHLSHVSRGEPFACLPGKAVTHALLDPNATEAVCITPRVLDSVCTELGFDSIESSLSDSIVVAWRVELADARDARRASEGETPEQRTP